MPKPVHSTGLTGICFFLVEAKLHPYLLVLNDWLLLNLGGDFLLIYQFIGDSVIVVAMLGNHNDCFNQ